MEKLTLPRDSTRVAWIAFIVFVAIATILTMGRAF